MSHVETHILGIPETIYSLKRGMRAASDFSDPLSEIADDIYRVIGINFSSQGRRGGGSWAMVSEEWARRKTSPLILIETGYLRDSMTTGDPHISSHRLEMESEAEYAAIHQFGGNGIPARPFVRFIDSDRERWHDLLSNHLIQAMRGV
jgi:phage gpG-like protein